MDPVWGWFKQHKFTKYVLEKLIRYFWHTNIYRTLLDRLLLVLNQDPFIQHHLQHASVLSCSLLFIYFQLHSQTHGLVQTPKTECAQLYKHIFKLYPYFFEICSKVFLLLCFVIFFGLISFSVSLFSVKNKNQFFKITLWIHLRWLSQDPVFILTLPTHTDLVSSKSHSLSPFFSLSQCCCLSISRAPSLSVLSAVMALSVCAERSIS